MCHTCSIYIPLAEVCEICVEKVCMPIMTKLYKAGGVASGAGGMAGGSSGSAGSGGKKSQGPTIEEVD